MGDKSKDMSAWEGWDKSKDMSAWEGFDKSKDKAAWEGWNKSKDKAAWEGWSKDGASKKSSGASEQPCTAEDHAALDQARAYTGQPLMILCLHGGGMDAPGMEGMIQNLADAFGRLVKFVYAQSPHPLWMGDAEKQGPESVRWWDDSLEYLKGFIAEHGPFDGVLGYSMGAASAFALLAAVPANTFRFGVICCGYVPTNDDVTMRVIEAARPLTVPTLHVHGREDPMTTMGLCDGVMEYFAPDACELCKHPGGHSQPYDMPHVNQIAAFLLRFAPGAL